MHRSLLLRGLLLAAGLRPAAAQAQLAPDSARVVLKLGLAPLLAHTYEAEAEYRWRRHLSLSLAPHIVAGLVPSFVSKLGAGAGDEVRGFGLRIGPRLYIPNTGTEGTALGGLYFGLQAVYQHLSLRFKKEAWGEDLAPDGLNYYVFRARDFTETINRYGGVATVGYQWQVFHPRLYLDASLGFNQRQSYSDAGAASRYRSDASDYAYSGNFLSLGLSVGFSLK